MDVHAALTSICVRNIIFRVVLIVRAVSILLM